MNRRSFLKLSALAATAPAVLPAEKPLTTEVDIRKYPVLNVVYLIPTDLQPHKDYERRLGEILLHMGAFYNSELKRNGSPACLRLPIDPATGLVKITIVPGSKPASAYPYQNGWRQAIPDIDTFYAKHPEQKRSERTLVIMPQQHNTGFPFYGLGERYCFAIDYADFDWKRCGEKSAAGREFTKWYGGMAHELGHGLGLPHNHATISQEKLFGEALMAAGNYTLGQKPTFLTPGSCALLESCPVCRVFDPKPLKKVNRINLTKDVNGREVRIRGRLPQGCTVRRIVAAYDKDDFGSVNDNYDAESFVIPFDMDGNFDFVFPLAEIHPGRTKAFQIQLRLAHADPNGTIELIRETIIPKGTK